MHIVTVNELIDHVLRNPLYYPGKFHDPIERTTRSLPKLSKERQMQLIWDAMCAYLRECLQNQRSVVLRKLGTFTFETTHTDHFDMQSVVPKDGYRLKLCFVAHDNLKASLGRYREKMAIRHTGTRSNFQKGPLRTVFLNEAPISSGCYVPLDVVRDALKQLFQAIVDLSKRNYELHLNFGVAKIRIANQDLVNVQICSKLDFYFKDTFHMRASSRGEALAVTARNTVGATWRSSKLSSSMMTFLERPRSADVTRRSRQCRNIGILSLDMTSCKFSNVMNTTR